MVTLGEKINWTKYLSQERKITYLKVQSSDQGKKVWLKKHDIQTCLVAQWIRICLPVHSTWVWCLVWEDPTFSGAAKPLCHRYWAQVLKPGATNTEPTRCSSWSPCAWSPYPQQEKPLQGEACALKPYSPPLKKAHTKQWRPRAAKNK